MVFTTNVCFGCSVQFLYSRVIISLSHMSEKLKSEYISSVDTAESSRFRGITEPAWLRWLSRSVNEMCRRALGKDSKESFAHSVNHITVFSRSA